MKRQQAGFTLVEIAIVLVIIGLLLGGILKGQEMITSGKAKSVINDIKAVSVAYYSYQDRYRTIPGDDLTAATKLNGAVNGTGDGVLGGNFNSVAAIAAGAATESNKFWQHTRMAGFMSGVATAAAALPPTNSVGGVVGIEDLAYGLAGAMACASLIPMAMAQSIDTTVDDGNRTTGDFRAGVAAAIPTTPAATATNYDVTTPTGLVTVCQRI